MTRNDLRAALDRCAERGMPAQFWLRDDDAVTPTPPLDRLLQITGARIPVTLAVIPADSGSALADRLTLAPQVTVAVHGWSHANHALPGQKSQELGPHRPVPVILAELATGFRHLAALHGAQFIPMLVPPWNRIDPKLLSGLSALGFRAVSVFGPERAGPLPMINTQVDLIDWQGTRGGRPEALLIAEIIARIDRHAPLGLLTHHLVHDAAAWDFLSLLVDMTTGHPGCRWVSARTLLP